MNTPFVKIKGLMDGWEKTPEHMNTLDISSVLQVCIIQKLKIDVFKTYRHHKK